MTPKQEAAMRQALEALEHHTAIKHPQQRCYRDDAIEALRAALAEPLQICGCRWDGEVQVQQCSLHQAHIDAIHDWAERAKTAEMKLVALSEILMPNQRRLFGYRDKRQREVEATPPQRKPLSDEEIDRIIANNVTITDQNLSGAVYMAMRELETAHGITGEGT